MDVDPLAVEFLRRQQLNDSDIAARYRVPVEEISAIERLELPGDKKKKGRWGHVKRGRRPDLGNVYFRSAMEANIARYLDFLKKAGEIEKWEYEPETFYFNDRGANLKRGTLSYTPDFKVSYADDQIEYWEPRGYMYQEGKVALRRMAKYFPEVKIRVIRYAEYRDIARSVGRLIPWWE